MINTVNKSLLLFLFILVTSCSSKISTSFNVENSVNLLVGTYTQGESEGIYIYKIDTISGQSILIDSVKVENPSFLTFSPDETTVYAVTESNDVSVDAVHSYLFNSQEGKLQYQNSQLTNSEAPCFLTTNPVASKLFTANYGGGSISSFDLDDNGLIDSISEIFTFDFVGDSTSVRKQAHLHHLLFSPDNKYLFANDLGNNLIYQFDISKSTDLAEYKSYSTGKSSGPRHSLFHPNGKWHYLLTEISGEVIAYTYEEDELREFQRIQADSLQAQGSGDIKITQNGKFMYTSHRLKGDGISIFQIDQTDGRLVKIAYQPTGIHPRHMEITPNGSLLLVACRDSNLIQVYRIDKTTGMLELLPFDISVPSPVCVRMSSK